MKSFKLFLNKIKTLIKSNPAIVLHKPWFLLFIPFIIVIVIVNNSFKRSHDRVFFVETDIEDYLHKNAALFERISNDKYVIESYESCSGFIQLLQLRLVDDSNAGIAYKIAVEKRFTENSNAFAIFQDGEPLGYIFVQKNKYQIPQVKYNLIMPKDVFTFIDLYIYKKFRGEGVHEILYTMSIEFLAKNGFHSFWCWLMEHNQVSIKAHIKIGISKITKIITRKSFMFFTKTSEVPVNMDLLDLVKEERK